MLHEQYEYFKTNRKELLKKYLGRFVAIKDFSVIADYGNFDEAYQDMSKKEKIGTFIIHQCVREEDEPVFSYSGNVSFSGVLRA